MRFSYFQAQFYSMNRAGWEINWISAKARKKQNLRITLKEKSTMYHTKRRQRKGVGFEDSRSRQSATEEERKKWKKS